MHATRLGSGSALIAILVIVVGCGGGGATPTLATTTTDPQAKLTLQRLKTETLELQRRKAALQRRLNAQRRASRATAAAPPPPTGAHAKPATSGTLLDAAARTSFAQLESQLGGEIGVTVSGAGQSAARETLGSLTTGVAWSTIKVPLAIAASRAGVADSGSLTRAITESDNSSAESLWSRLGSETTAASAVQAVLRDGGDTSTTVNATRTRPEFSAFGQTVWPLDAQERFVAALPCVRGSGSVLQLMRAVVSTQRWGLGSTGLAAAFKGGWGPDPSGHYLVRQMGLLTLRNGRILAMTLMAQPSSGEFGAGTEALTRLAQWTVAHVDENAVPPERC
jgi:hypothetical protein